MSTKIYTGFKVKDIEAFKKEMEEKANELAMRKIAKFLTDNLAYSMVSLNEKLSINTLLFIFNDRLNTIYLASQRDVEVDIGIQVSLWKQKNTYYGIFNAETGMSEAITGNSNYQEYVYQNQTDDLPKGVSFVDWEDRKQRWDNLLKHDADHDINLIPDVKSLVESPQFESIFIDVFNNTFQEKLKKNIRDHIIDQQVNDDFPTVKKGKALSISEFMHQYEFYREQPWVAEKTEEKFQEFLKNGLDFKTVTGYSKDIEINLS